MKREILFRGKRAKDGKWIYGFLTQDAHQRLGIIENPLTFSSIVDKETVGQFTGLLGKKGNKIFEGDVCKGSANSCRVVYGSGAFRWNSETGPVISKNDCDNSEVIGNVHDNWELLK